MPQYIYRAITKEGLVVKNKVESPSKQNLIKRLKGSDLLPIDVVQVGYGLDRTRVAKKRNVSDMDEIVRTANSARINQGRARKQTLYEKINLRLSTQQKITTRDIMIFTQNFYLLKKQILTIFMH